MTGYGAATKQNQILKVEIEAKSVNSKFLDLNLRLPRLIQPLEMDIRNLINKHVMRGKVMFSANVQILDLGNAKRNINIDLFNSYLEDVKQLTTQNGLNDSNLLQVVMNMPEVLDTTTQELDAETAKLVMTCCQETIENLQQFRADEGKALSTELENYCNNIEATLKQIDQIKDQRIDTIKKRLQDLHDRYELSDKVDNNRYEQEVLYFIEKLEITEEIVRLNNHINYFKKELKGTGSGKKLGFISQEMGREINTIGSKANHDGIQHMVVDMKEELEKIKEQVLNIL
ncbi:MAG: YicC family protein [Bacteroidetes bacterium]|nr:YicC family protein [Bacteroidota bacterium]